MISFSVMADLHADIVHDAKDRMKAFIDETNRRNCDFAIQLGDFIQPDFKGGYICEEDRVSPAMRNSIEGRGIGPEEKTEIFDKSKELNCPLYHVMGNHDLDLYTKAEVMKYWGMEKLFYSFDAKNFHFIVLDANYGFEDGQGVEFERGNYMKWFFQPCEPFPYIPRSQLEWLENDLDSTDKPSIVFCHEGLNGGFLNAVNHDEIFGILKKAPRGVKLCMCGHKHEDLLEYEENIPVYFVNSMSGYSVPAKFAFKRFSEETEEKYPNVRYMCVYDKPLYVIVTIDDEKISIEGRKADFVPPKPDEIGVKFDHGKITLTPNAGDAVIKL